MIHHWSGPHGVPGGLQRWQHGSYRWRRVLEATVLIVLALILAPKVLALAEVVAGAALMTLGLMLLPLALVGHALRGHRLIEGLALGGLVGWVLGRRGR